MELKKMAVGDGAKELFGSALLLVLTVVSWYFRPESRKLSSANSTAARQ